MKIAFSLAGNFKNTQKVTFANNSYYFWFWEETIKILKIINFDVISLANT